MVDFFVVVPAEEGAVLGAGFAAVGPVGGGVVDFAAGCWLLAAWVDAVLVAGDYGGADVGWYGALAAADVEYLAVGPEYDASEGAVFG